MRSVRRLARLAAAICLAIAPVAGAFAQALRDIPPDAPRGRMSHMTELQVELDGRPALLAANARVMSADNLVIVPAAIPAGSMVRYRLDADRYIDRVWILTPDEAAVPVRGR